MNNQEDQAAAVNKQEAITSSSIRQETQLEKEAAQAAAEYGQVEKNGQSSMRVKVYSPFHDYYDDQAFSLSAVNATGPFDILPKHHNFISLLDACELLIRTVSSGDKRIQISSGLMHVKADQVIVFLDV